MKLPTILRLDWAIGVMAAFIAALIINLPLWNGLLFEGEIQRKDVILESGDEVFYLTRIREAADGHIWAGHPYLYERRDQRYPLGNLWEGIIGTKMRVFNLDIKTATTLADAVLPFLLVLIFWMAMRPVLPQKKWRLLLIGILFLGFELYWWKRPISPQATAILPMLYFWALFHTQRNSMRLTAVRGILIGLMTLSYPFHWTYCLATEGLLTLHLLWKDRTWTARMKRVAAISIPFVLCALPWMIMMLDASKNPEYAEVLARLGLVTRRFPAGLNLQMYLVLAGALVWFVRRKMDDKTIPNTLLILLAAGIAVLNQMIITGKEAEFSSHYRQILVFPFWMSLTWVGMNLTHGKKLMEAIILGASAVLLFIQTMLATQVGLQLYERLRTNPERDQPMHMVEALNMLEGEQVILADDEFSRHYMTIYTAHYPFFTTSSHMYLMDEDMLWKRAAVQQELFPDYRIIERGMVGSSNLNRALHDQTICRIRTLLHLTNEPCARNPKDYLPPEWYALQEAHPSQEEMLQTLKDAHVTHALMKRVPEWLRAHVTSIETLEGYELLRFED